MKYGCGRNCDWLINVGDMCTFCFVSRNVCGFNGEWKHGFRKIVGIILLFCHDFYVKLDKNILRSTVACTLDVCVLNISFMQVRNVGCFNISYIQQKHAVMNVAELGK